MSAWDRLAKKFDGPAADPETDVAVQHALRLLPPDANVLEIGCATGATAETLRPHVASWHGIDISQEMIRRANARSIDATFTQCLIGEVPGTYDAIIAFNVLHFMTEEDLDHIHGCHREGGLFLAQTPCTGDMKARFILPIIAFSMRLKDLRQLRFQDLKASIAKRFHIMEAQSKPPTQTWIVAKKETSMQPL